MIFVPSSVKDGDVCDVLTSKGKLRGKFGISPKMHVKFENTECSVGALEPGTNKNNTNSILGLNDSLFGPIGIDRAEM